MTTSRRKFLQGAAHSGIAAATLSAFPPSIRKALAIPAYNETGTIRDVKHVVILMQENRSFDHYFGMLKGTRGFGDRFTVPQPGGRSVWEQLDASGNPVTPYHLDWTKGNAQRVSGTPHSWVDGQLAWLDGRYGYWPAVKKTASMSYYEEAEMPFQYALANAFTVCDGYHCSMHTGTNSNRMFLWTGTNGPSGTGVASLNNEWDGFSPSDDGSVGYEWKTYPERLQAAGVSWIVYENMPDNYGDNSLVGFKQYRAANQASGKPVGTDGGPYPAYDPASDDAHNPLYKGVANTMPGTAGDVDGYFKKFREDCLNGKLPQVSWVVAPATYSEHPGPSSPVQGAWYIQQVLDALTANPDVWSKTVLFVNFDENDGYFDHVPSPAAPAPLPDGSLAGKTTLSAAELAYEYNNYPSPPGTTGQPQKGGSNYDYGAQDGRVYGPGVRVPMYVISPWSRGGWVNSQAFDHTSVIRFLEARFGVKEPNIAPFRRAVLGDLTSAFNFANPNREPLPTLAGRKTKAEADALRAAQQALPQITPPAGRSLPAQATGYRPSRALPYELNVVAQVQERLGRLRLVFRNSGRAAAVFHVYDKLKLDAMPSRQPIPTDPAALLAFRDQQYPVPHRYMVQPRRLLDDVWNVQTDNAGRYDFWVLGPNGFHRRFKGDLTALRARVAPSPEVQLSYDPRNGGLRLEARNDGTGPVTLRVRSNKVYGSLTATGSGGAAGGSGTAWELKFSGRGEQALYWNLDATGWWYDFIVTSDQDPSFLRRLAGRMETGRHSVSDPGMGLVDSF
ncbi:phosphocholine-specific phospholipase C [Rubrivivax gelatinosus]|uniref:phospholipase C n=1 Tax=Rubrivivax gelatinosus (strain NBRC 100245 / IL144) TaxID=983917 RepID=I0HRA5_RUBGI|nr:phospholipase C, phosphocholine-specific [Rubrivivax gelatinosus]BAL95542.1 phospholipase C [Rubrivivax gelatinosus IL144]